MSTVHLVAATLIERDGRFLFVQEGKKHVHGLWNLPAGGVHEREPIPDAARRESLEEAGVSVTVQHLVGTYLHHRQEKPDVLIYVFTGETSDDPVTPDGDEILAARFQEFEMVATALRSPYIRKAIADYRAGTRLPLDATTFFTD